jgi:DNA-binding transcriptional MerR regulator
MQSSQFVSTTEAARIANKSAETIRKWAKTGYLVPVLTVGLIRLYDRADSPVAK